jgi:hypothetical protein
MAPAEHTLHGQHIGFREDELANPLPVLTLRIAAPTISLTVTPCASMIASVQPLALLASNSRARWRVAGGLRLRCVGIGREHRTKAGRSASVPTVVAAKALNFILSLAPPSPRRGFSSGRRLALADFIVRHYGIRLS